MSVLERRGERRAVTVDLPATGRSRVKPGAATTRVSSASTAGISQVRHSEREESCVCMMILIKTIDSDSA